MLKISCCAGVIPSVEVLRRMNKMEELGTVYHPEDKTLSTMATHSEIKISTFSRVGKIERRRGALAGGSQQVVQGFLPRYCSEAQCVKD